MKQKLITKEVEERLNAFKFYSQDGVKDKKVLVKFFGGSFTWVVVEAEKLNDGDWNFFGWVDLGYGGEWGYFRFSDIKDIKIPLRMTNGKIIGSLNIEREIHEHYKNGYTISPDGKLKYNRRK